MRKWATSLLAIDPQSGELFEWAGPTIEAPSWALAEAYCERNELGYCKIVGELLAEIPCDKDLNPKWNQAIYYDKIQNN